MNTSIAEGALSLVRRIPRLIVVVGGVLFIAISVLFIFSFVMSQDNRTPIAQALLYDPPMKREQYEKRIDPVFSGALTGKFPVGTDYSRLLSFVSNLGGWCSKYPEDKPRSYTHACSIVIESELFSSIDLKIEAKIDQGKVVELQASQTHEFY